MSLMHVEITPEPSAEEREAILTALTQEERESGGGAAAPEPWRDAGVVQPGDPRQHERDE
jgi:hypothetical protein